MSNRAVVYILLGVVLFYLVTCLKLTKIDENLVKSDQHLQEKVGKIDKN